MADAYIVDAVRSPTGRRKGGLAGVHGADLGAHVLKTLVERNGIPDADYDDVMFGCVDTIGPLAGDIARTCWLAAGLDEAVPGTTIDRQCGSSQQAVHFAAQAIMAGVNDVVIAGGVQTMTQIPISSAMLAAEPLGFSDPFSGSEGWVERYGNVPVSQFNSAQMIADKWGLSRSDMEAFALQSHTRALQAISEGRFAREIAPLAGVEMDETPRQTTMEKMAELQPLQEGGTITAAVSSQTCDASSAMLIVSEAALKRYNLTPRARIAHMSVRAADPIWMLTAPIPATEYALKRAGMRLADIDLVEINEAFASVAMAWLKDTGYDPAKTNVNGGAIALGHPLGATGTKLMTTLLHELERSGGRYGLQTMCEGGGQANVTIIERL
ncbi:MAG TPA: acetyl-CoA C-acetyltransferase [Halieaceae bacterium]|jgi:acetyl-CoA C-acetyltransferase|uniref:acetyl-CoA C-acetyltransferase n=1 Tax=Haliea TaxID=475794 RepID=UPI000C6A66CF|nr:acetyl-CoA C-acetyltransferase [Haliea sp.]HBQ41535.1 acetyl-CoA C-acetyltransferase [Halieaceae bacterium]MAD64807.1 acetyl-CoA C-acyltransferase [Haliea sp.]MAY94313.1 acetyl-CoA C-acyltransferase [Haliea sp.]MBP71007.1 acetyl-CoA C-acyltransferase [Haliea sp.]HCD54795.1 acetyl-CoA C-acetyltransferase [Halieaceae bacterium]|tara:strand:+ start:3029 stop:4177 length:1149 start_codon:yes stop_codon:yes gene_type:complete